MLLVGLTGGIGSGKSTAAKIFKLLGIPVYIADVEAKRLINTNEQIRSAFIERYGSDIYLPEGTINKAKLGNIIFTQKEELQFVNATVHPIVKKDFKEWAARQDAPYVIEEAAILFESGSHKVMDVVITVTAPEHERIMRVRKRDNLTEEQIKSRINNQFPEEDKIRLSDFVIHNDDNKLIIPQIIEIDKKIRDNGKIR